MKVFSAPEHLTVPRLDISDFALYEQQCAAYREELAQFVKDYGNGDPLIGEIVRFPVADSFAEYMVASTKPFQLIHLELGDAWDYPYIERLRIKDIRDAIKRQKNLASRSAYLSSVRKVASDA